jgi:hypothetical protein
MKTRWAKPIVVLFFLFTAVTAAQPQTGNLYGLLYRQNPSGSYPIPLSNYEIHLYARSTGWIGPSLTDRFGKYAFYNVPPGRYLMRIQFRNRQVWQQEVQVPGTVSPIVLPANR